MKKLIILSVLIALFSCQKNPSIKWEENKSFAEIIESTDDKYIMIDFVKDG